MTDIRVPLPRLLDDDLQEVRRLHPTAMSVTANLTGLGEADITLADTDEAPAMHAFVEIYTARGSMGIYRITNVGRNYRREITLTLRHAIDTLSDSLWRAQEVWTGTMTQYLTRLLTFQTSARWQLGTCACDTQIKEKSLNYDRLSALLEEVEDEAEDYCLEYDFTTSPWTVSLIGKPAAVSAEFRLNRNASDCDITLDDSEMCNRLRLSANHVNYNSSGKKTSVDTVYLDYNNTASQAVWGIVEKVADIDVGENVKAGEHAECDAWAARFLSERANPSVQIEIDGLELKELTADEWDEPTLGEKCRVALPEYGQTFTERVVAITWPDPIGEPLRISVSLANVLPKFSETLAQVQRTANKAGRVSARAARDAEVSGYWDMVVRDIDETITGVGVRTLYETGIILDAHSGATIYSLMEGLEALNSTLKVSAHGVQSLVMASGAVLDANGDPVLDPDGNVTFQTGANCLYSQVNQVADEITSQVIQMGSIAGLEPFDDDIEYAVGDCCLYNNNAYKFIVAHHAHEGWDSTDVARLVPLSSRVTQTEDNWSATVTAVGSGGAITAASIVAAIDNTSGASIVRLDADHVLLSSSGGTTVSLGDKVGVLGALTITGGILYAGGGIIASGDVQASGGNLVTGSGGAVRIVGTSSGEYYDLTAANIPYFIKDASVNTAGTTLTLTRVNGTTVTFNKASTTPTLSGSWSGGVLTVTSNPAAASNLYYYMAGGTATWSGTTATIPITYSTTQSGQATNTGGQATLNVASKLQAKTGTNKVTSNGTVTPGSGYIGLSSVEVDVPSTSSVNDIQLTDSLTWYASGSQVPSATNLGQLATMILDHKNDRGTIVFSAKLTGVTGTKWYKISIGGV